MLNNFWNWIKSFRKAKPVVKRTIPRKIITLDITDENNIKYYFSKRVVPEDVSLTFLKLGTLVDIKSIVKELELNGYNDVQYRIGLQASRRYNDIMLDLLTTPIQNADENVKDTQTTPNKDKDRPIIEPFSFGGKPNGK